MKSWLDCCIPFLLGMCCTAQSFCKPPEIDFGEIVKNMKLAYMEHDRLLYQCQSGYDLEGSGWITCKENGWMPTPKCLAPCVITKEQLTERNLILRDGQKHSELIRNGHTMEFVCKKGYITVSPSIKKCIDGKFYLPFCNSTEPDADEMFVASAWNSSQTEETCAVPHIDNGNFLPEQRQYKITDVIYASCNSGFTLENPDHASKCTKYGWLPYPKCVAKHCEYPRIEHGALSWSNTYYSDVYFPKKEGDTINFRCYRGFLPENKKRWHIIRCTSYGWEPEPKCFKQCILPKHLPHGQIIVGSENIFIEGDDISFLCDEGYHPEHLSPTAVCTKTDWSPALKCLATGASSWENKDFDK
ncbi:complement factor H [Anolis carolinensis]|uniref:complement factor H n=1 Tax=Anolis carolinensis TaxID=28377 RepID=UPI000203AA16|nr:PREDICTED: complement factor H isoform X1 [Anolis carolinensis]|eukprot:XP_008118188.1 PREDICTED: complement factor H isoform X1 [Anolis carolinensis]